MLESADEKTADAKERRWNVWRQFDRSFMVPLFGGPTSQSDESMMEEPLPPEEDMEVVVQRGLLDRTLSTSSITI